MANVVQQKSKTTFSGEREETSIGALGTIPIGLVKGLENFEIEGHVETIRHTTLRTTRILRRVLETYCHSPFKTGVKNSYGLLMIMCKW